MGETPLTDMTKIFLLTDLYQLLRLRSVRTLFAKWRTRKSSAPSTGYGNACLKGPNLAHVGGITGMG